MPHADAVQVRRLTGQDADAFFHLRLQGLEREPEAFTESAEEFRRTGTGHVLHQVASSPGIEQILLRVGSANSAAKRLYESLGFQTCGSEPRVLKVRGKYVDEETMVRRLAHQKPQRNPSSIV